MYGKSYDTLAREGLTDLMQSDNTYIERVALVLSSYVGWEMIEFVVRMGEVARKVSQGWAGIKFGRHEKKKRVRSDLCQKQ